MGWTQRPMTPVPPPDPRPVYKIRTYLNFPFFAEALEDMWKEGYELHSWNKAHSTEAVTAVFMRRNR